MLIMPPTNDFYYILITNFIWYTVIKASGSQPGGLRKLTNGQQNYLNLLKQITILMYWSKFTSLKYYRYLI